MKENLLDALMYLFENYVSEEIPLQANKQIIKTEMVTAGFQRDRVYEAFEWFVVLKKSAVEFGKNKTVSTQNIRIYSPQELAKITPEARGCILYLEQTGILDARTRELIIDSVMELAEPVIEVPEIKWVSLLVLYNLPELSEQIGWLEDFVFNGPCEIQH